MFVIELGDFLWSVDVLVDMINKVRYVRISVLMCVLRMLE